MNIKCAFSERALVGMMKLWGPILGLSEVEKLQTVAHCKYYLLKLLRSGDAPRERGAKVV